MYIHVYTYVVPFDGTLRSECVTQVNRNVLAALGCRVVGESVHETSCTNKVSR